MHRSPRPLAKPTSNPKLKLLGFNNLTKSLSFNIYDICYARTAQHQQEYIEYIDEAYNAERLTDKQRTAAKQVLASARAMQAEGVVELDDGGW